MAQFRKEVNIKSTIQMNPSILCIHLSIFDPIAAIENHKNNKNGYDDI